MRRAGAPALRMVDWSEPEEEYTGAGEDPAHNYKSFERAQQLSRRSAHRKRRRCPEATVSALSARSRFLASTVAQSAVTCVRAGRCGPWPDQQLEQDGGGTPYALSTIAVMASTWRGVHAHSRVLSGAVA